MLQRVMSSVSFWLVCLSVLCLSETRGSAQIQSPDGTEMFAGDFVKGAVAEFPVVGNRWNLLRLVLSNRHDRPVDLQVAIYFDIDPTLQYSRRIQIPAGTVVRTWLPILVPGPEHIVDRAYSFHVLVRSLGDSTGLIPDQAGSMQLDRTLQVESQESAVGLIHTFPPEQYLDTEYVEPTTVGAIDLLLTGRYAKGLRRNWRTLTPGFAAGSGTGLLSLDQLVVGNETLLDNPDGLNAIRRWVFGGGRLWVMLDRVDSRTLELILGDRYQGQELERVELTKVELVDRSGKHDLLREFDTPVPMTRLLIDDVDVSYSVDGWPAAFWIDYGEGRVLVTTLGANGWVRPRLKTDPPTQAGSGWETDAVPLPAFEELIARFLTYEESAQEIEPVLLSQMEGDIGFRIPARGSVVSVLMGYALLSLMLAVWLWKTGRLPLFGVLGPVLALAAAGTLLGTRPEGGDIPSTAVVSQLVTPIPGSDDVRVRGVVGLYARDASPLELSGDATGWMMPDMEGFRSGIRTLTYDDEFSWEWEHLRNQPGFHSAEFEWSGPFDRVSAIASFDERGISGTLKLPDGLIPEDAIVDARLGRIGVRITEEGKFTARQSDTLSKEQFLGADLLGDEQRRRIATLQQLMETPSRPWNSGQPHLLLWTQPWNIGFQISDSFQRRGSALVVIPLQLIRPPSGQRITIPGPLLPFREVTGPNGKSPIGLYNFKKQEWTEKNYSTSTWLQFDLPDNLLPLSLERVDLQIGVTGPVGQLELSRWDGSQLISLRRWDNPVGTLTASFSASDGLSLSENGNLQLFLSAGEGIYDASSDSSVTRSRWRIESFDLSVEVIVLEPEP